MNEQITRASHAVLMPMAHTLEWQRWMPRFFAAGGRSLLLGQDMAEYRAHVLSPERLATETIQHITVLRERAHRTAGAEVMLAIDAELGALQRLQKFVDSLPSVAEAAALPDDELESIARRVASQSRAVGITCFLGPVLDVLIGRNDWLTGRTMSSDVDEVTRIGSAIIRGFQSGGVAATAKHFPGQGRLAIDPIDHDVALELTAQELDAALTPFRAAIRDSVALLMVGPARVTLWDPDQPPATSSATIDIVRSRLGFTGVIVTGDLDAASTMRGRAIEDTAALAIARGVDLLLIPDPAQIDSIAERLSRGVNSGEIASSRLIAAARAVEQLVETFPPPHIPSTPTHQE